MTSPETDQLCIRVLCVKFLGGAALGAFLILLPILYSDIHSLAQLTNLQLGFGGVIVLSCGCLTLKWGTQVIDAVMAGLENAGF